VSTRGKSHEDPSRHYAVDERLVMPETRFEVIDGEVVYVSPADCPHASAHSKLSALLEACVAPEYDATVDMLTRTGEMGDMAPDASIYPREPDPKTGGRQLEALAFEVVSTESLSHAAVKAARLVARGVRRVFAIDVGRAKALEWSRRTDGWEILAPEAVVTDEALAAPLVIRDLLGAARVDDALARALLARSNPVLDAALADREARGEARGEAKGRAAGIFNLLAARGIAVDEATRARIAATRDLALLDRWLLTAATCSSAAELADDQVG
jgi:hypothetical protein